MFRKLRLSLFFSLFLFFVTNTNLYSQDVIVLTDGEEIEANVVEITTETIKFRIFQNPQGPLRNIRINDVFMIIYEDGSRESFSSSMSNTRGNARGNVSSPTGVNTDSGSQNYTGIGFGYGNSFGGLGISLNIVTGDDSKLGFHVGGGYFPAGDTFLFAGGLRFYLTDDLFLNGQFGSFGTINTFQSGSGSFEIDGGTLYGPSLLIGYELSLTEQFAIFSSVGGSYDISDWSYGALFALDSGIMVKF